MNNLYAFLKPVLLVNLYLVPLVLFLHSANLYFPYVTTKAFFFFVVAEIAFACWALLAIKDKKYRFKPNFLFYAFTAFTLITLIADIFGLNFYKSFWSNSERMDGTLMSLHVFIYFITLLGTLRTSKAWRNYLKYSLFLIVAVAAASMIKEWDKVSELANYRLSSHLGNPIYMATVSVLGIFMSAFFFFKEKFTKEYLWPKVGYAAVALFLLYIIFLTGTRGALVGTAVGLLAFCLTNFFTEKESKGLKYLSGAGILIFIAVVSSFFFLKDDLVKTDFVQNNNLLKRTLSISADDRTTRNRLATWEIAIEGFKEKPLLGHGRESYEYVFSKYYIPEKLYDGETWFDRSHNVHLDKLVFSGTFGFIAYLAVYFFAFQLIWTRKKLNNREKSALTALLVGHFVQGSFVFESVSSYVVMTAIFAYIGFSEKEDQKQKESESLRKDIWATLFVVSALVVSMTFFVIKPYVVNKTFLRAILYSNVSASVSLSQCDQILTSRKSDVMTRMAKGYCLEMRELDYDPAKKDQPIINHIESSLFQDTFISKEIMEKLITDKYLLFGMQKDALNYLDAVVNKEIPGLFDRYPDDNKLTAYYALYLIKTGRLDYAGNFVNRAYNLGPEKFSNVNIKAEYLIKRGEDDDAIEILEEILEKGRNDTSRKLLRSI